MSGSASAEVQEDSGRLGAEKQLKELGMTLPTPPESFGTYVEAVQRYRNDVPNGEVHVLDAGHFALDTAADEIAGLVRNSVGFSRSAAKGQI
jgi:hypothetical protein